MSDVVDAARAKVLEILDAERVRGFADAWRQLAREWAERAKACEDSERAEQLRTRAQIALYGAHEADELPKRCGRVAQGLADEPTR